MATLNDAVRRIGQAVAEHQIAFAGGQWWHEAMPSDQTGLMAVSLMSRIQGLKEALDLIAELQRDN